MKLLTFYFPQNYSREIRKQKNMFIYFCIFLSLSSQYGYRDILHDIIKNAYAINHHKIE